MEVFIYIIFFLFGTVLGSFFNVLGFRIPNNESIIKPGSHCMKCNHTLNWYELIPIVSYIFQKGKCRDCHEKISILYPFIELATGILFFVSYYSMGFSYDLIIALSLVSLFMVVIVSDLTYLIIPDSFIIIPSIIIFIVKIINLGIIQALYSLIYGLFAFSLMFLIMKLGNKLFNKESMGGADIKLMFIVGLTLDPMLAVIVIFLASVVALPVSFIILIKNKEHVIPFGPFIILSLLIVYFTKFDIMQIFNNILDFF